MRDLDQARHDAVAQALEAGHRTSSSRDQASAFEVASEALAGTEAGGSPASFKRSFYSERKRIREREKDSPRPEAYSHSMSEEHETERPMTILTVRVPADELEALRQVAAREERSMSGVLRLALRRILAEQGRVPEIRA